MNVVVPSPLPNGKNTAIVFKLTVEGLLTTTVDDVLETTVVPAGTQVVSIGLPILI